MTELDPNDFIITRKRKKYKFAKFANSPLCYELEAWQKADDIDVIELGAGTGLFGVELASRHPERQYLCIDVKADRLQVGANEAEARGLQNIRFLRARADQLEEVVSSKSLQELWLTFPDPFPRVRSAGRRMTNQTYLYTYTKMLKKNGALCVKHDNLPFFLWSLEQLVACSWTIAELSFDLHDSQLPDDYKIITTYEKRWLDEGLVTNFVRANRP